MKSTLKYKPKNLFSCFVTMPYLPIIIFGCFIFVMHLVMKTNTGDDIWFSEVLASYNYDPIEFSIMRYYQWSSRTLIELMLLFSVNTPVIIWKILDTLMIVVIAVFLSKTLVREEYRYQGNIVIVSLMLVYTYISVASAGWIATTVNYIWPLAFGLIAIYPLRKVIKKKKIQIYEYIIYSIALIIGANHEQMVMVLFAVYSAFAVYMFFRKRINAYVLVQFALCLFSFIYILTCPGNAARSVSETAHWFPEYAAFTLLQKVEVGLSACLSSLFLKNNWLFFALCLFVFIMIWKKHKSVLYRGIAAIPVLSLSVLLMLYPYANDQHYWVKRLFNIVTSYGFIDSKSVSSKMTFLVLFGMLFICCALLISLYILLGNKLGTLITAGILLLGAATKVAIGFSPTIWASGDRTGVFLSFSLIAVMAYLINEWNLQNKNATQLMLTLVTIFGISGGIVNILSVGHVI